MVAITSETFDDTYHSLLYRMHYNFDFEVTARKTPMKEILNVTFELVYPRFNVINSVNRGFKLSYAEAFARYIKNGGENIDELISLNPVAFRYISDKHVKGHQVNYGARIKEQLPRVIKLLQDDPGTRRACINILNSEDFIIAETPQATMEYPCCETIKLYIRNEELHMIVNMRSQNIVTVLPYDVYNFTSLQMMIAEDLKLGLGNYYHNMGSAHYYKNEEIYVKQIIDEYDQRESISPSDR